MNGPTHLLGGVTAGLIASSFIGAHDAQFTVRRVRVRDYEVDLIIDVRLLVAYG